MPMRVGPVFIALLLWTSQLGVGQAQTSRQWRSPDGAIGVTTPSAWRVIYDEVRADDHPLIVASPEMAARQEDCSVLVIEHPRGPLPHDQSMLNNARADLNAAGMFAAPDIVHSFSNEIVDGVRVVSYDVERDGSRLMERHLQTSRRGQRTEYVLSCQVDGAAAADIEASAQWLASLEIRR